MSKQNQISLKWKVFIYLLVFCALLLGILWLFQTILLNDTYRMIRTRELSQAIDIIEKEINNPELQTVINQIQMENDITISFTQDFPEFPSQKQDFEPPQGEGIMFPNRRNTSLPEAITETKDFTLENGETLSLTFHAMIIPVNATVVTLRTQLYFITGIMLLLSVLLALMIARRVSGPIEDISRSARTLATGNYDTRFSGDGFQEIVALSDTLNTAAAELGKVEGLRRELLANVSHDLRTPLALIYSHAEMMNDFPDEITADQTQLIMDETKRLTSLVNDVLDISKLESNMELLTVTRFNLTDNLAKTMERLGALLKNDGFEILFSHDEEITIHADETKIDRVFYNLLINAVNYSGNARKISVIQKVSDGRVRISVTDSGEGIAENELTSIWERYYKSGKKHKRAITGTGLGLSIVKKIVELHNGDYGVTSKIGVGSTFWFELKLF